MSRLLLTASFGLMLSSGVALAATTMTSPDEAAGNATNSRSGAALPNRPKTQPGMAATSSDSAQMGTGASSAAIGTDGTERGMLSPKAPGVAPEQGETGANPNKTVGVPPVDNGK